MRDRDRSKIPWAAVVLVILAAIGLVWGIAYSGRPGLAPAKLRETMVPQLMRLLLFLGVGLLAGIIIELTGWAERISRLVRPMTRWGNLKDESAAAFITGFVSSLTANALLAEFLREGRITKREVILTYLLNNGLPVYLNHLPTSLFIVISLAGNAGFVYLAVTFGAACLRSLGVLLYTRLVLPPPSPTWSALVENPVNRGEDTKTRIKKRFKERFARMAAYTVPIYILIFLAGELGFFHVMRKSASGLVGEGWFPVEAVALIVFSLAAEFGSGMAAAGALLQTGALTVKQTALALIAGTILSTPIRAVRHQLPTHVGLFELTLGTQLLLMSQTLRVLSIIAVSVPYVILG